MEKCIRIKYHTDEIDKLCYVEGKSDWIDLRAARDYEIKKGGFQLVDLGISVMLPEGYEMVIVPRSSLFKNYGLIQTNGMGIIDESYCSNEDHIMMPVFATRDTIIKRNDRICQFRIMEHQPKIIFEETDKLYNPKRGGFGATGRS